MLRPHIRSFAEVGFTGDETISGKVMLLHEHRTSVVAHIADLQHDLELLSWKLACYAGAFGVTAGEANS